MINTEWDMAKPADVYSEYHPYHEYHNDYMGLDLDRAAKSPEFDDTSAQQHSNYRVLPSYRGGVILMPI